MAAKRQHIEMDPDYEDVSEVQSKRRRLLEEGAAAATKKKISSIIDKQFNLEVENKETELLNISEQLEMARAMMDRLRACIVASYYGNASQIKTQQKNVTQPPTIHPTVRKYIGKAPKGTPLTTPGQLQSRALQEGIQVKTEAPEGKSRTEEASERIGQMASKCKAVSSMPASNGVHGDLDTRCGRYKLKRRIIVGNVSKSIPADQRDENDQATHKWMVYVRGPKERPNISDIVKKVWFFLHPSYRPNDLVQVSEHPFHLTRRGWGEFPVRVQLHFRDTRNKRLDIIHNLKLDRTYTGLQTLGSETVVDIELERDAVPVSKPSCGSAIKQEPDHDINSTSDMQGTSVVKTEPPDDHDYGHVTEKLGNGKCTAAADPSTPEKSPMNASILISSTIGATSVPAPRSASFATSQPLTLIPVQGLGQTGSPGLLRVAPLTPTKQTVFSHSNSTSVNQVSTGSPVRNIVLQGVGSLTSTVVLDNKVIGQGNMQKNSVPQLIALSPVKTTGNTTNFAVPQQLVLTSITGGQQIKHLSLPVASSQPGRVNSSPNPPQNAGLIFLKCTDSQGKTFLIPQQVFSSASSPIRSQSTPITGQCNTVSHGSQALILTTSLPKTNASSQVIANQSGQFVVKISQQSDVTGKPLTQNGPVLFLKPDTSSSARKVASLLTTKPNISPEVNTGKLKACTPNVRNTFPSQIAMPVQQLTPGSQSLFRGQLKVTPQGLMHIQGQKLNANNTNEQSVILMNGNLNSKLAGGNQNKQPLILVPATMNNKIVGKGKSLLSSPFNNLAVSQSNGNVILVNHASAITTNNQNNGRLVLTNQVSTNKNIDKINANNTRISSASNSITITSPPSQTHKNLSNHIVIVPVTSHPPISMVTQVQGHSVVTTSQTLLKCVNSVSNISGKMAGMESRSQEKTMLIVVPSDDAKRSCVTLNSTSQPERSMSSLLGSRLPQVSIATKEMEMPVTISSSNQKQKQIIVVNEMKSEMHTLHSGVEKEKKIIVLEPKRRKQQQNRDAEFPEFIKPLCICDYADLTSLIRAAIIRHPVVSNSHGKTLHPYCAKSREEWLSWNIGKRRASEWQRASAVRRYLRSYLTEGVIFHGETMWSTRQILTWCRIHSYSPHYLERPLHPTAIDLQSETSLTPGKQHQRFSSVTDSNQLTQEITPLQEVMSSDSGDEDVDVTSLESKAPVKQRPVEEAAVMGDTELLPLCDGSIFVELVAQKVGVCLSPTLVSPGYMATVTHGTLYKAMEQFMEDILRKTFALQVNMGRYPDTVGVADVFLALENLPVADFLTNKYMGVPDVPMPRTER
ncbi:YEATS domain-containing protein 2-like [Dreissena polymorpha]|nr:YEATS domain-containing protein 2-like [Dreissena polymorpha]